MAQSRGYKKTMNFVYGMGAAVVIIGALFKIQHIEIFGISGGLMLTIGLLVEAAVFAISAFDAPEDEFDWSKVYPELGEDGITVEEKVGAEGLSSASESISSTNKYNEQVTMAAAQMESLNGLYKIQVENTSKQAEMNAAVVENTERLKEQMDSLAKNLSSLNGVYGGMLSAMSSK